MAIDATRLLQPRTTGITESVSPRILNRSDTAQIIPEENGMVIRITISDLIRQLNTIARRNNIKSIGFRPQLLSEDFDLEIAKKAKLLAVSLKQKPDQYSIKNAMMFLGAHEIIEGLLKLKNKFEVRTLGFKEEPVTKENEIVVRNLQLLANELLKNPNDYILAIAIDFIESINLAHRFGRNFTAKGDSSIDPELN